MIFGFVSDGTLGFENTVHVEVPTWIYWFVARIVSVLITLRVLKSEWPVTLADRPSTPHFVNAAYILVLTHSFVHPALYTVQPF